MATDTRLSVEGAASLDGLQISVDITVAIVRMDILNPLQLRTLRLPGSPNKFTIGTIDEFLSVWSIHPNEDRHAVGQRPKSLFTLTQCTLRTPVLGDIDCDGSNHHRPIL